MELTEKADKKFKWSAIPEFCGKWLAAALFLMILAQTAHLLFRGEAYCPNEGCRIVDEQSPLSPIVTNVGGLLYFAILFLLFRAARKRPEGGGAARFLLAPCLLAGMAAEGVLSIFQVQTSAFCAYCCTILAGLFLINLCLGKRQALNAIFTFCGVAVAAFLLTSPKGEGPIAAAQSIRAGTQFVKTGPEGSDIRYFFFKESCKYCKPVLDELMQDNNATLRLNPLAELKKMEFPEATPQSVFVPEANRIFLRGLGINSVPVLLVQRANGSMSLYMGVSQIGEYLQEGVSEVAPGTPAMNKAPAPAADDLEPIDPKSGEPMPQQSEPAAEQKPEDSPPSPPAAPSEAQTPESGQPADPPGADPAETQSATTENSATPESAGQAGQTSSQSVETPGLPPTDKDSCSIDKDCN